MRMKVAVLGLGEAGSLLAADLARSGDEVHGYDPAPVSMIDGVDRYQTPEAAVAGCTLVLAVIHSSQAAALLEKIASSLDEGVIYADLSTGSPRLKQGLADTATGPGASFADVALMAPVPGRGLATPALASGAGADRYAELINARGGQVEVVGERAGEAAARKLLRSVVMKGLAALLIESTEAATRYGQAEWFRAHLVDQLGSIDEALIERLLSATTSHAPRRLEEMEAARDLLVEVGALPTMTNATIAHLRRLIEEDTAEIVPRIDQPRQ
jgi:3-hydroxyisobutyrate dehydrogenase-like beta-hydroxyacid dehydrogenase